MIPYTRWQTLEEEMRHLALAHDDGVLKVILTRGAGGRGYSGASCQAPHVSSAFRLIRRIMRAGKKPALR